MANDNTITVPTPQKAICLYAIGQSFMTRTIELPRCFPTANVAVAAFHTIAAIAVALARI